MTPKISGLSKTEPVAPAKGGSAVTEKSQGDGSAVAGSTAKTADHVTLTDSARSLQKIEEAVAKTPVVNAQKVADVKHAVSSGTYKIDADRIASKLFNFERGLK